MLWIIPATAISYLLGSIPNAYIFGRVLGGVDIRKVGSGNVGATNALRVLGKGAGVAVLLLDILKGFLAVILLGAIFGPRITLVSSESLRIVLGVACILGHNWPVFLGFKGGKGIATTLGVMIGLAAGISGLRAVLLVLLLTWLAVFLLAKIVSLASIVTAVALPLYLILFKLPVSLIVLGIVLSILVIWRHKANLIRLLQGKEPRLQFRKTQ
ncbi:MAG: glycerol-3-phosphate 1-O-acyltransferase PlsY [Candidatus Omnitrophota bacterium]|jgi:glycerol-3-phosphate acyltransferase PlsY